MAVMRALCIKYLKRGFISKYENGSLMDWNDTVELVEGFCIEAFEKDNHISKVVRLLIDSGNNEESERPNALKSIKAILQNRDGSPFRQGVRSNLPVRVKVNIGKISRMVRNASIAYFDSVPSLLIRKHGKSGGGGYANANEYANNEVKKIKIVLQRRFSKGEWDGTMEGIGFKIAPLEEE